MKCCSLCSRMYSQFSSAANVINFSPEKNKRKLSRSRHFSLKHHESCKKCWACPTTHQHVAKHKTEEKFLFTFDFRRRSSRNFYFPPSALTFHVGFVLLWEKEFFTQMGVEITCFIQFWNKQQTDGRKHNSQPFFCVRAKHGISISVALCESNEILFLLILFSMRFEKSFSLFRHPLF